MIPALSSIGTPTIGTMHQAAMPPWKTDEEAEDYRRDPKAFLLDRCALWVGNCEVFHNWIITATYYLPDYDVLSGGHKIFRTDSTHDEALFQGKVGLVVAMGPLAFKNEPGVDFGGQKVEIGDWVQYDILEGRQFTVDRIHCRRLKDTQLVMKLCDPRLIY